MAAKKKSNGNQKRPDNRGGARAGAGRKPRAVTEIRAALIAEIAGDGAALTEDARTDAAEYAFRLFVRVMRDDAHKVPIRLECAAEVLNRVWGRPAPAAPAKAEAPAGVTPEAIARAAEIRAERARRRGDGG